MAASEPRSDPQLIESHLFYIFWGLVAACSLQYAESKTRFSNVVN